MQHLWSQILNFFVFHFIQHKFPPHTLPSFDQCSCSNEMVAFTLLWCQFTCLAQLPITLQSTSYLCFVGILPTGCLSIKWRQILLKLLALCSTHLTQTHHFQQVLQNSLPNNISTLFPYCSPSSMPSICVRHLCLLVRSSPTKARSCL